MKDDDLIFGIHACKQFLNHNSSYVEEILLQDGKAADRLQEELELENTSRHWYYHNL